MKIVIIGYGGMGSYHFTRMKNVEGITVKGVYDIDAKRNAAAEKQGLLVYKSYKEVAKDKDVDAVLIATPNDSHKFYINYFAQAGKKVLCEKPAVSTVSEFENVLDNTRGKLVTFNQNRRFDLDFLTAKEIIENGNIGKVYRIESRVTGANGIPGGWRKIKKQGGGMMLDWGVHLIDQICTVFPVIESLSCTYSYALGFDVEDGFILTLNASGTQIIIEVQTNDYCGTPRWKLFGRDGSAVIENWSLEGKIVKPVYGEQIEAVAISAGNGLTKTMAYRSHDSVDTLPLPKVETDPDTIYKNLVSAAKPEDLTVQKDTVMRVLMIMELCKKSAARGGALLKTGE